MIFALQIAAAACFQPLIPLSESRTMQAVLGEGQDYGRIRLWGSITFVVGVLAMGWASRSCPLMAFSGCFSPGSDSPWWRR